MIKCPLCDTETIVKLMDGEKTTVCPNCGAFKDINPNSGNTVWKRGGRVVLAEEDVKDQLEDAKQRYPNSKFEEETIAN